MTHTRWPPAVVAIWTAATLWRALVGHYSLNTNAFDLSVFDYTLWGLAHGHTGFAAFFGHSEFSDHFEPILLLVAPFYALFHSAVFLIVLQIAAVAAAGWTFVMFQQRLGLPGPIVMGLLVVDLLARRSHGAAMSFFYPESLQPLLTFALVLAWPRGGWRYWVPLLLLLSTKEDMTLAVAAFGALQWMRDPLTRRRATVTLGVASIWLVVAMFVAIPWSRTHDGLTGRFNPVFSRFTDDEGHVDPAALAGRVFGGDGIGTAAGVLAATGFVSLGGGAWLLPALPGALISMAAKRGEMQASLMNHYFWAILPWLFIATAVGVARWHRRWPRMSSAFVACLVAWTIVDSPAIRGVVRTRQDPRATEVLAQLHSHGLEGIVLAQANLIPHLPKSNQIFAVGSDTPPPAAPRWVLLTGVGDQWPLDPDRTAALIERYRRDPAYALVTAGPLFAFERKP